MNTNLCKFCYITVCWLIKFALSFVCTSHFEFPSAEKFDFEQPVLTHDFLVIFGPIDIITI
jgi:hypothetical protein